MKKALPPLLALFLLFALAPGINSWGTRVNNSLTGSKYYPGVGIYGALVYDTLLPDYVINNLLENLDIDLITAGGAIPSTWRGEYFAVPYTVMTYTLDQGENYFRRAELARIAGAWDNVSYFLGIATHYWAYTVEMSHHDNIDYHSPASPYYNDYDTWNALEDHMREQVYFYRTTLTHDNYISEAPEQVSLNDYINNVARPLLEDFIDKTAQPGTTDGWWLEWVDGTSATHPTLDYGDVHIEVKYPRDCGAAKATIDLAALLCYNAWIRVLGLQSYF